MPANAHIAVYSCLWMFPGWLGSDKSSTSAPRCRKCEPGAGEVELSEHAAYTPAPNRSTTRIKPPAIPSIISSIPPLADGLGNQKLHFRSKWPVLARVKSKVELSVFVPYPPGLYAGSTCLSTHLAAPHPYDARHFKNAYPVTPNRNFSSRRHNEPMATPQALA